MIIFSTLKEIPQELLEFKNIRQVIVYNLSSYYNNAPTLNLLIPSDINIPEKVLIGDCDDAEFDMYYHNYIMSYDAAFMQLMNIVNQAFMYPDILIHIMIQHSPFSDAITESLMKLIQQRYGMNSYVINEIEDFLYTEENDCSVPGVFLMDKDISRMLSISVIPGDEYE